jgi:hypothetical protein
MSERSAMTCQEFAGIAAELALGVLTGRERAEAVAHLDRCDACWETIRQLTMTGEELLGLLLPEAEPPAGFETRVLARIGITVPGSAPAHPPAGPAAKVLAGPAARRRAGAHARRPARTPGGAVRGRARRALTAAAVTLAVAAAAIGGWGLRAAMSPAAVPATSASSPLLSAALTSASGQRVGRIFYYTGSPGWAYMSVDIPSATGTVVCELEDAGGHFSRAGSFGLIGGYGAWGSADPGIAGKVTGARLLSASGTVLAMARF